MNWKKVFIPRVEIIFLAAIFLGVTASGPKIINFDGDLPRHLLVGQQILKTSHVSTVDIFSFRTMGFPSYPHEWLAQVLFSIPYILLNLNGVVLFTATLVTLTFAIIYKTARQKATPITALFFTGLALFVSTIHLLPRPHLFTYLCLALWIFIIEQHSQKENHGWWVFPVIMLFWVNLHGMFVVGLLVWVAYVIGGILEIGIKKWIGQLSSLRLLISGFVCLPVTLLTPTGIKNWKAIFDLGNNSYLTSRISEFSSANFQLPETWFFIGTICLLVIGLALNKKQLPWPQIILLVGFLSLALYSSRMIPIFAIIAAPIMSQLFSNWVFTENENSTFVKSENFFANMEKQTGGTIWIIITILALTIFLSTGIQISPKIKSNEFENRFFPVDAVKWLEKNQQTGNMFNDFKWGGYIILKTWPKYQIFMDGHTHIFGESLTREYEHVVALYPGWDNILENYQVKWAIVPPKSKIALEMKREGWHILYQDQTAIIFRK